MKDTEDYTSYPPEKDIFNQWETADIDVDKLSLEDLLLCENSTDEK